MNGSLATLFYIFLPGAPLCDEFHLAAVVDCKYEQLSESHASVAYTVDWKQIQVSGDWFCTFMGHASKRLTIEAARRTEPSSVHTAAPAVPTPAHDLVQLNGSIRAPSTQTKSRQDSSPTEESQSGGKAGVDRDIDGSSWPEVGAPGDRVGDGAGIQKSSTGQHGMGSEEETRKAPASGDKRGNMAKKMLTSVENGSRIVNALEPSDLRTRLDFDRERQKDNSFIARLDGSPNHTTAISWSGDRYISRMCWSQC
ncbi:unnamed protein product [Protopolystoma xenopodis]|uniref:Uncharacterized protein n=1 Tax=Protopolystoma xenopodis TaxID=117903 RepID=A0A448WDY0_9PLAT|nr:unnamed protein product [Protopolystoma xenopodis]